MGGGIKYLLDVIKTMACTLCGVSDGFPYTCKFCSREFCSAHRLPENHDCDGLRKWKEEKSESKHIYPPFQKEKKGGLPVSKETLIKVGIILVLLAALVVFAVIR